MKDAMRNVLAISAILLIAHVGKAADPSSLALVPRPLSVERGNGEFVLAQDTAILIDKDSAEAAAVASLLVERINRSTGLTLAVTPADGTTAIRNAIRLTADKANASLGDEGYTLNVTPDGVVIAATNGAGLFYGTQTLLQLLPPQIFAPMKVEGITAWTMPAVRIEDRPRFRWRGLMLDVARHFFGKDEIKTFLDLMAQHKLNVFHWHLVDDQGWRIEIKQFPKLTESGAWRNRDIWFGTEYPANAPYGGFFTHNDIRELIAYAKTRYITIVPEIEMPGHSGAALAAYPELSCTGQPTNVFCAGNDATFEFLETVLSNVFDVFPGKYIHIGGDEALKDNWKNCPKCQARIQQEGLKNESELQSYLIRRIEKFVIAHNRTLIGWDEILEGGLAPSAVVMSWRSFDGGIAAANAGQDAVMTPHTHCYFDYPQAATGEPRGWGFPSPLQNTYSFEPIPPTVAADKTQHILGAAANLWTEFVPHFAHAQYMIYPRACALAEVTWTDAKHKDWSDFRHRLDTHLQRLHAQGVNYRPPRAEDAADIAP